MPENAAFVKNVRYILHHIEPTGADGTSPTEFFYPSGEIP
jgi:hypothetical protein